VCSEPRQANKKTHGYLRTLVYQDHQSDHVIAIEGTINSITAALEPYPFYTCKIGDLANIADLFCSAEPTGIGAPFFRSDICLRFSRSVEHLSKQQIACLLLEAIIFRVALILEDFIQQPTNTRIYLSGGLADSSCLQQGIAMCSSAPVFKLLQKHSSLQGTALLINNLAPATYRQSEAIIKTKHQALVEKYHLWKVWFKGLINS
jgi:glycerol kinase